MRTSFSVAQLVVLAFRGARAVQPQPRMLGVKVGGKEAKTIFRNSLKPSWSAVDLSDEGEVVWKFGFFYGLNRSYGGKRAKADFYF